MSKKWTWILIVFSLVLAAVASFLTYPQLPQQVVSHWNAQGQPDDMIGRFWGVAIIPIGMLLVTGLLWLVPVIDPLRENIEKFRPTYHLFLVILNAYLLYIHLLTLAWGLGIRYDLNLALTPAVAIFLFLIGMLLNKAKRNWFIGIRTPWTLSSDFVWERTHQRGGRLFKIAAGVMLFSLLFPQALLIFLILPVFAILIYLAVYSFIMFRYENVSSSHPDQ